MLSQLVCKRSCFDGSPFSGRALVKEVHYSGRPQVHTIYACGFTANKVQIKRSLNLLTVNTMCTNDLRKSQTSTPSPRPQPPIPTLIFFFFFFCYLPFCLWSYSMWEVRNDPWRFMVAYHFCIDQISLFFLWVHMISATCGRCEMIQDVCPGGISFLHWSLNFVPVIWYYNI